MNGFTRLPGFQRSAPGWEWVLWKRLPAILLLGGLLPSLWLLASWWSAPALPTAAEERALMLQSYQLLGWLLVHATLVLTLAIGCFIVRVMKGPAYVADAYPPAGRQ
jgi:hypothetical protein